MLLRGAVLPSRFVLAPLGFFIGFDLRFFVAPFGDWNDLNNRYALIVDIVGDDDARTGFSGFRTLRRIEIDKESQSVKPTTSG
jgi:hypothetical protein